MLYDPTDIVGTDWYNSTGTGTRLKRCGIVSFKPTTLTATGN